MIESKRLMLRKMTQDDFDAIAEMLRNISNQNKPGQGFDGL